METQLQVTEIKEDFWGKIPSNIKTKFKICKKDEISLSSLEHCSTVFTYLNDIDYISEYNKAIAHITKKVTEKFYNIEDEILGLNPLMFDLVKHDEFNRVMIIFYYDILQTNI